MELPTIRKTISIRAAKDEVFAAFIKEIYNWWPREYTWSGKKLVDLKITGRINGLCTETGPHQFRCDWGRITVLDEGERIGLKWQIGPHREPVPDPEKASDLLIEFREKDNTTLLSLEHSNFCNTVPELKSI